MVFPPKLKDFFLKLKDPENLFVTVVFEVSIISCSNFPSDRYLITNFDSF